MEPRIYVASLSDYNAGRLHGTWIDCDQDADSIRDKIAAMLLTSPEPVAEEWAIHDTDGFGSYAVSEYEDLETLVEIAEGISEHGDAFTAWMGNDSYNKPEGFVDAYVGTYDTFREYADDEAEQLLAIHDTPDAIRYYFDWEYYARDLEHEYTVIEGADGVHVFQP